MSVSTVVGRLFGRTQGLDPETEAYSRPSADLSAGPAALGLSAIGRTALFPGFLTSAIDRASGRGERGKILSARLALRDIFTPSQPVTDRVNFAGRLDTLARLIDIIEGQRSHVVIYGERGIGKTSLLHILAEIARESHYIVVYDSCGAHSRFDVMFRGILQDVPLLYHSSVSPTSQEAERGRTLAERLPDKPFDARLLGDLCAQVTGTRVMIILDEYDRVEDPEFRQSVAELIKNLSDRAARVQLVISGVASNLQELVGYIPSIRRNIVGLPMPRLSAEEVRALIALGESAAGVHFADDAVESITILAHGSPYVTRLLSHHASAVALDDERLTVNLNDLPKALERILREAGSRVERRMGEAAERLAVSQQRDVAAAAARAASTPDGWFVVEDISEQLGGKDAHAVLNVLNDIADNGDLLQANGNGSERRFRFRDDALPIYLQMLVAQDHFRDHKMRDAQQLAS